ncbi:hypothetical protein Q4566_00065 [Tamlana sp. 2_MG-2023]|uniref:hypothetical protein n=1 Tax=unclassified Tamlana TaxID=2614803 RepID=UPI0026E42475|nr:MULTISPECIES: hypothetical protein [unclassified Tamlana]MDO6758575.1 hypothetical protein [Tamlana sp. 2_MG-2023]MDO6789274.1 hypothetical protein [Tamlana sp. 1_MG-2023]
MRKLINISLVVFVGYFNVGCDDIFEEDITNDFVNITSPKNGIVLTGNSVQFRWDLIDGANAYRVQVVEQFTQIRSLDSLVEGNSFTFGLNPGEYSWVVRAENFAYETAYSFPELFTLVSSNDLSNQTVFLGFPSQDYYTNTDEIILTWDEIQSADSYNLEIDKTFRGNTGTEVQFLGITNTNYTLDSSVLSEDAIYTWKVRGVNENSSTKFTSRRIFLDTQNPNQPMLNLPNSDDTTTDIVNFSWSLGSDSGEIKSPVSSILEVAIDNGFGNIILTENVDENSKQIVFTSKGEYYWRVKAIDQASNQSIPSEVRKLTVQ